MRTMYCASKHGLSGFGKALRAEVKPHNCHVLNIYPTYVQTNISRNALLGSGESFGKLDNNIKKGIPCDDAANQILKAMTL
mmetsp:Transcript_19791/g.14225  ORF Transcript_19791/g.14225 Transcript_19791/m.14225 type:complete len:81 (+) Transcript_19791:515-757(+)